MFLISRFSVDAALRFAVIPVAASLSLSPTPSALASDTARGGKAEVPVAEARRDEGRPASADGGKKSGAEKPGAEKSGAKKSPERKSPERKSLETRSAGKKAAAEAPVSAETLAALERRRASAGQDGGVAVACGDPSAGDCCTPHATPTCSDLACCTQVCAADPFCCYTSWDGLCANAALSNCSVCGGAGSLGLCGLVETSLSDPDWVLATSDWILRDDLCVASAPCLSTAWYENVFAPCYNGVRYFKLASGAGSGWAFTMASLGAGTFDGLFVRDGVVAELIAPGSSQPSHSLAGPVFVSVEYWQDVACDGFASNTTLVPGGAGALTDYSITIGAPPTIVKVDGLDAINEPAHNTNRFPADASSLYLRRADTFDISVELSKEYSPDCYNLRAVLTHDFDGAPTEIVVAEGGVGWSLEKLEVTPAANGGKKQRLRIAIPPDAPVGDYELRVELRRNGNDTVVAQGAFVGEVIILFNPWKAADHVFVADAASRTEYVTREQGRIWVGSRAANNPRGWFYGQFADSVIDSTLGLLDGLTAAKRADAGLTARHLTKQINGFVLQGKWPAPSEVNPYDGGVAPGTWNSSEDIFDKYRTGGKVKFGQCWVFAGVLTTSLRSLGIPSRPLTNFDSGHERQPFNNVIERSIQPDGSFRNEGGSIWNFHVWCDMWKGAWNAVDATPQELSVHDNTLSCGPAPHVKVKAHAGGPFDVEFVTGEVDADVGYYKFDGTNWALVKTVTNAVGHLISTKAVGGNARQDITAQYKNPEAPPMPPPSEVSVFIDAPSEVSVGADLAWTITVVNSSALPVVADVAAAAVMLGYDGEYLATAGTATGGATIAPGTVWSMQAVVPASAIAASSGFAERVEMTALVDFPSGGGSAYEVRGADISRGRVTVSIPPTVAVGASMSATVLVENTSGAPMQAATLRIESGSKLLLDADSVVEIPIGTLAIGESRSFTQSVTGVAAGDSFVAAVVLPTDGRSATAMQDVVVVDGLAADIDGDGFVNGNDLAILLAAWGTNDPAADIDGDGVIGGGDLGTLLAAWTG